MKIIDRRGAASVAGTVAFATAVAKTAQEVGIFHDLIVGTVIPIAAATSITSVIAYRPSVDAQIYRLRVAMRAGSSESPVGLSGMCTPSDASELKARLNTELPSAIIAKYWILRGITPESQSRKSVLQEIQNIEARCYRGLPKLDPEVALRIVGALTELSPEDTATLEREDLVADWQTRRQALEHAMVEARYYQILALEQRRLRDGTGHGGHNQKAKEKPSRHDVPSQRQVAVYFLLTGDVPKAHWSGLMVQRAIRRVERSRVAPMDPVAAKHVVFLLLNLENQHDALLPAHNQATRRIDGFPYLYSGRPSEEAAPLYQAIMDHPVSVLDAFVGRDGWHYVRGPSSARGHECVIARRGDKVSCFTARRERVEREWGLFKAERCAIPLKLDGDTDTWTAMLRAQLAGQSKQAEGMTAPVEYLWPSDNGTSPWSAGRQRLQSWAETTLSTKPAARVISVPRVVAHLRPSTLV